MQQANEAGEINFLRLARAAFRPLGCGGGVETECGRRVAAGHFHAIEPADEPVVVVHTQQEQVEVGGPRERERRAQVSRGIAVAHHRGNVSADE